MPLSLFRRRIVFMYYIKCKEEKVQQNGEAEYFGILPTFPVCRPLPQSTKNPNNSLTYSCSSVKGAPSQTKVSRQASTRRFFGEITPKYGWSGWPIPKQAQKKQNHPKIALFNPNFTIHSPKSHKNHGVGGWLNTFERTLPKREFFLGEKLP